MTLKVYISADLEGVANVVYPYQVSSLGGESYNYARKQQLLELNRIIDALLSSGIEEITVNDAHGSMDNISYQELNPNVELITGKPKPVSMLHGLDKSYSFIILAGYHAKATSQTGVLAHTISQEFKSVKLNGNYVGEIELNAIFAGFHDVPIAMITGDDITCKEASQLLGAVKTVATKTAISTTSARCKPLTKLKSEIQQCVFDTVANIQYFTVYKKNAPFNLELEFKDRSKADLAVLLPNIERCSDTTISYTTYDYAELYKLLQFFAAVS